MTRRLKRRRNYQKMGMIPGSSTVEHSAVNRRVASSNLARGANLRFFSHLNATRTFGPLPKGRWFKSGPRNHFVIHKAGTQDSGLFRAPLAGHRLFEPACLATFNRLCLLAASRH